MGRVYKRGEKDLLKGGGFTEGVERAGLRKGREGFTKGM